ncbi:MAG: DUF2330 domain-containing protein, partial [Myxococcales bacterium]|nr:DUF2330 domain-containing protein [Myxococcales bacterium]
ACGGMFCDNQQDPMPVDQTGEVILFRVTADSVEAHIQIQYDPNTEASRFAWIVPVTAQPEITVGSERLFLNVQNATVPAYGFQSSFEACDYGGGDYGGYDGSSCSGGATGAGTSGGGSGGPGGEDPPMMGGTTVLAQDSVGAFDYAILESQTVDDLMTWLGDNAYYQDPNAAPILDEYIQEGHLFVAFRLTQGSSVGEIHPIVLTYPGNEPCVPIRLTRIAAQQDMDIRAFFLGDDRFAPTNYRHVVVNPLKLDHFQFAGNYKEAVTLAVDGPEAEGHAFVTEYAGESKVVPTEGVYSELWDAGVFQGATPLTVVSLLDAAELFRCVGDVCESYHALVPGLLAKYVPVPDGVEPDAFYSCVECFADLVDMAAWDAAAFAAELDERVIQPGKHAVDMLGSHPYLTRLYTTLSPAEMTVDPVFHETSGLEEIDLRSSLASVYTPCAGATTVTLSGFTPVDVKVFQTWPDVAPESMPWAERVELVPPVGTPQVLLDNTEVIEQLIGEWNAGARVDSPQPRCYGDDDDDDDGTDTANADGDDEGCGCRADGGGLQPVVFACLLLGGALLGRRRRR